MRASPALGRCRRKAGAESLRLPNARQRWLLLSASAHALTATPLSGPLSSPSVGESVSNTFEEDGEGCEEKHGAAPTLKRPVPWLSMGEWQQLLRLPDSPSSGHAASSASVSEDEVRAREAREDRERRKAIVEGWGLASDEQLRKYCGARGPRVKTETEARVNAFVAARRYAEGICDVVRRELCRLSTFAAYKRFPFEPLKITSDCAHVYTLSQLLMRYRADLHDTRYLSQNVNVQHHFKDLWCPLLTASLVSGGNWVNFKCKTMAVGVAQNYERVYEPFTHLLCEWLEHFGFGVRVTEAPNVELRYPGDLKIGRVGVKKSVGEETDENGEIERFSWEEEDRVVNAAKLRNFTHEYTQRKRDKRNWVAKMARQGVDGARKFLHAFKVWDREKYAHFRTLEHRYVWSPSRFQGDNFQLSLLAMIRDIHAAFPLKYDAIVKHGWLSQCEAQAILPIIPPPPRETKEYPHAVEKTVEYVSKLFRGIFLEHILTAFREGVYEALCDHLRPSSAKSRDEEDIFSDSEWRSVKETEAMRRALLGSPPNSAEIARRERKRRKAMSRKKRGDFQFCSPMESGTNFDDTDDEDNENDEDDEEDDWNDESEAKDEENGDEERVREWVDDDPKIAKYETRGDPSRFVAPGGKIDNPPQVCMSRLREFLEALGAERCYNAKGNLRTTLLRKAQPSENESGGKDGSDRSDGRGKKKVRAKIITALAPEAFAQQSEKELTRDSVPIVLARRETKRCNWMAFDISESPMGAFLRKFA